MRDPAEKSEFKWVRSIFGKGDDAKKQYNFIPNKGMNEVIKNWQKKQPEREFTCATPSRLTQCPRSVWLQVHNVPPTEDRTWAVKQRMMLGRKLEDMFAMQLENEGILIYHWKDNPGDEVAKFVSGSGTSRLEGVPDYILDLNGKSTVSDAKTSRSDSFGYVPIEAPEIWEDGGWFKYKVQVEAYYKLMLDNELQLSKLGIPTPEQCHLFSYALDDGIVRREIIWTPTAFDLQQVEFYTERFNKAMIAKEMPDCTCAETPDGFEIKFCPYAVKEKGAKIGTSCCDDSLLELVK